MKTRDIVYTCLSLVTVLVLIFLNISILKGTDRDKNTRANVRITGWDNNRSTSYLPETVYSNLDIIDTMTESIELTCFLQVLTEAGLVELLEEKGPFTVFIPVDEAFEQYKTDSGIIKSYFSPFIDKRVLVKNHIVRDFIIVDSLANKDNINTITGNRLNVRRENGIIYVENSVILKSFRCENGIIHIVDNLLIPGKERKCLSTAGILQ
jgi:uncharacterized surface protein with fasciclin (FAS1) repeats